MRDLNCELKGLCRRNRAGSFSKQRSRSRILDLAANQLHEFGYRKMSARPLKPTHVEALVAVWRDGGRTRGWKAFIPTTIKTRMAAIRWWADRVGTPFVVTGDNSYYGIPNRVYTSNENHSTVLGTTMLERVGCLYIRASFREGIRLGSRKTPATKKHVVTRAV